MKDQELHKNKIKLLKTIDITLFILCFINLILWILRACYVLDIYTLGIAQLVYNHLFIPMVLALFILPTLVVASTFNRTITLDSFLFLSLKCIVLNLLLLFLLK